MTDYVELIKNEGRMEAQIEIILKMLEEHIETDFIKRVSGWTEDQIRALAQKNDLTIK